MVEFLSYGEDHLAHCRRRVDRLAKADSKMELQESSGNLTFLQLVTWC